MVWHASGRPYVSLEIGSILALLSGRRPTIRLPWAPGNASRRSSVHRDQLNVMSALFNILKKMSASIIGINLLGLNNYCNHLRWSLTRLSLTTVSPSWNWANLSNRRWKAVLSKLLDSGLDIPFMIWTEAVKTVKSWLVAVQSLPKKVGRV